MSWRTRGARWAALALLAATSGACNLILGTQAPVPDGPGGSSAASGTASESSSASSSSSSGTIGPVPCGSDQWTHWVPTAAHAFSTSKGSDGNSVVTDELTGLAWQTPPPASQSAVEWANASAYCMGLSWGGLTDYRLPTLVELASLARFDLDAPAIDPTAFPGAQGGGAFWTQSNSSASQSAAWIVTLGNGAIGWKGMTQTASVRCVHDRKPAPNASCTRLSLADGGGSVADAETKLVWQRAQSAGMVSLDDAKTACGALTLGGQKWRVPTVAEMITVLDVESMSPTGLDPDFFPTTEPAEVYWTATVDASAPTANAWTIDTNTGVGATLLTSDMLYVRCVRSSS